MAQGNNPQPPQQAAPAPVAVRAPELNQRQRDWQRATGILRSRSRVGAPAGAPRGTSSSLGKVLRFLAVVTLTAAIVASVALVVIWGHFWPLFYQVEAVIKGGVYHEITVDSFDPVEIKVDKAGSWTFKVLEQKHYRYTCKGVPGDRYAFVISAANNLPFTNPRQTYLVQAEHSQGVLIAYSDYTKDAPVSNEGLVAVSKGTQSVFVKPNISSREAGCRMTVPITVPVVLYPHS